MDHDQQLQLPHHCFMTPVTTAPAEPVANAAPQSPGPVRSPLPLGHPSQLLPLQRSTHVAYSPLARWMTDDHTHDPPYLALASHYSASTTAQLTPRLHQQTSYSFEMGSISPTAAAKSLPSPSQSPKKRMSRRASAPIPLQQPISTSRRASLPCNSMGDHVTAALMSPPPPHRMNASPDLLLRQRKLKTIDTTMTSRSSPLHPSLYPPPSLGKASSSVSSPSLAAESPSFLQAVEPLNALIVDATQHTRAIPDGASVSRCHANERDPSIAGLKRFNSAVDAVLIGAKKRRRGVIIAATSSGPDYSSDEIERISDDPSCALELVIAAAERAVAADDSEHCISSNSSSIDKNKNISNSIISGKTDKNAEIEVDTSSRVEFMEMASCSPSSTSLSPPLPSVNRRLQPQAGTVSTPNESCGPGSGSGDASEVPHSCTAWNCPNCCSSTDATLRLTTEARQSAADGRCDSVDVGDSDCGETGMRNSAGDDVVQLDSPTSDRMDTDSARFSDGETTESIERSADRGSSKDSSLSHFFESLTAGTSIAKAASTTTGENLDALMQSQLAAGGGGGELYRPSSILDLAISSSTTTSGADDAFEDRGVVDGAAFVKGGVMERQEAPKRHHQQQQQSGKLVTTPPPSPQQKQNNRKLTSVAEVS